MANELTNKRMEDEELEQVVGGCKVMVVTHMKDGKYNAYHSNFQGDLSKLETLAKGGSVSSLDFSGSWGSMKGMTQDKMAKLMERYQARGYKIIETYEK